LRYSDRAMNKASKNGHLLILKWWLVSGLKLKYSMEAIYRAHERGHYNVLEWWKDSGLKFPTNDIDWATILKRENLLNHICKCCFGFMDKPYPMYDSNNVYIEAKCLRCGWINSA
jgi:hypothetical protein